MAKCVALFLLVGVAAQAVFAVNDGESSQLLLMMFNLDFVER